MKSGKTRVMPRIKRGGSPPIDSSYEAIGQRMKRLRLAVGLTQKQMAKVLGISRPAITRQESGEDRISVDHAMIVKEQFSVGLEWIYLGITDDLSREARKLLGYPVPPQEDDPSP